MITLNGLASSYKRLIINHIKLLMKQPGWLLLVWLPSAVIAQSVERPAIAQTLDLSLATKRNLTTVALSINRLHGLGAAQHFRIGYGLRLTSAFGRNTDYKTAPPELVKGEGKGSVIGLFTRDLDENIDTLRLPQTQGYSINLSFNLEYVLSHRVEIGFNIDVIGFTFGPNQRGTFIANSPVQSFLSGTVQESRLTPFNLLLGDKSDRGSLNSEGYARYQLNPRFSLRTGLSFQFNEYTTASKLTFGNDRFRSSNLRVLLAAAYHF